MTDNISQSESDFIAYIEVAFDYNLLRHVSKPENYLAGEKVLYKLRGGGEAVSPDRQTPRLVDIQGWDIAFENPLRKYFESNDILPDPYFTIEWLFGLYFGSYEKKLVLIDFTHTKVKGIFSDIYEATENTYVLPSKSAADLQVFCSRLSRLKTEADRYPGKYEWVKIVLLKSEIQTRSRGK